MTGVIVTRAEPGETYWAPVSVAGVFAPLVYGENRGVIVDGVSQDTGVVYSSRERAEAALGDPAVWHPSARGRVVVAPIVAVTRRRFVWPVSVWPGVAGGVLEVTRAD